ncbi:hypothetical protein BCR42DRAFT_417805 [Absidia repens]|uniref:Pentacotripeptide-repeat region of PRORP domain-containing protein n=1 Tax=Absidia repens TaxID=90262 RepID=A0A1X2ICQ7_9FUNG|nr:hypothetical protein BCR42DRAFT_417805 [Absidia repens]
MRKSMTHLIDASPLLSRRRLERPLTTISTCCWQSHIRDLLYCFGDSFYHDLRSRFYSTTSCAAIPTHSSSSPTSTTLANTSDVSPSSDIPSSIQLYGALAIFNFTDHITLSNLEEALRRKQAEKAWQLFCTLTNKCSDSDKNTSNLMESYGGQQHTTSDENSSMDTENGQGVDDLPMILLTVPYHHCIDLYALLLFAQDLSVHPNVIAMRQQQLDKVATYVEEELGQSKSMFIDSVSRLPVPTYKRLQQSLQNKHQQSAWKYYTQILSEDPVGAPSIITRNHYLKLLSLVMRTEKRYLNDQQKQDMIQLVTMAHEGIPCKHGRVLTADAIEWIALIYSQYDHQQPKRGRRLVHEFLQDCSNQHPTADTVGELVWRIIPYDVKTAHKILNTMHQRGLPQNESTYNNLIKAYTGDKQYERALGVFEQMLTVGIVPTVPTFNAVIHIFADQGLTDRAVYMWDTLHALDLVPDAATYSEMIRCFGRVGQLKNCLHYYQLIEQQQHSSAKSVTSPNLYTYSTLIEAYGKRNDVRGVLRWFQNLLRQGLEPNEVIMANVLKALGKHHQQTNMMEAVKRIAKQCMSAGIKADTTLYTLLLTLQADATPTPRIRSSMLSPLSSSTTATISTSSASPSISTSTSTTSSSLSTKASTTALPSLSSSSSSLLSSSSSSSSSSTSSSSPVPNTMEENTDLAFALQSQREMLAKCVEPNHGYLDTARQIFDLMQQSDRQQPTTVTYCAMLDVLRYANQKEQVDLLLYDYLGNRLRVDIKLKHQFRCLHGC